MAPDGPMEGHGQNYIPPSSAGDKKAFQRQRRLRLAAR